MKTYKGLKAEEQLEILELVNEIKKENPSKYLPSLKRLHEIYDNTDNVNVVKYINHLYCDIFNEAKATCHCKSDTMMNNPYMTMAAGNMPNYMGYPFGSFGNNMTGFDYNPMPYNALPPQQDYSSMALCTKVCEFNTICNGSEAIEESSDLSTDDVEPTQYFKDMIGKRSEMLQQQLREDAWSKKHIKEMMDELKKYQCKPINNPLEEQQDIDCMVDEDKEKTISDIHVREAMDIIDKADPFMDYVDSVFKGNSVKEE